MRYREMLETQKIWMNSSIRWWPDYLYHFTDIKNALGILDKEWIFARNVAVSQNLMQSDNASKNVIDITMEDAKDYARLYFRPLTPTQYHNEGYKPEHVRKSEVNASCPVPVFFCLNAEKVLELAGTGFVEKGLAGTSHEQIQYGTDYFANLNFQKIYHNGSHERGSDITQYRHSEVIRRGGIPINGIVQKIVCRSLAEKQTLLYLLQRQLPYKYKKYYHMIEYNPGRNMFYRNGIFVQRVSQTFDGLYIELNDVQLRSGRTEANGCDVHVRIVIDWFDRRNMQIIKRESQNCELNYALHIGINVPLQQRATDLALVEITFDNILMYQDYVDLSAQLVM